jgi:diguanylate cyclase (GGDEF)-like protein
MPSAQTLPQPEPREHYGVLLDIGRTIAGALEPAELYRTIYVQASRVLETTGFYISLYDPEEDRATVVFYADRGLVRQPDLTYRGSGSRAIREARPILEHISSPDQARLLLRDHEDEEVTRSTIAAPLLRDGQVLGVISVQSYRAGAFDHLDLDLLAAIADLAAVAISNARAVGELERQRWEYQQLEAVGRAISASLDLDQVLNRIVAAARQLTPADGTAVWLLDTEGTAEVAMSDGEAALPVGTAAPLAEAFRRRLAEERKPVLIDDATASEILPPEIRGRYQAGSAIALPLIAETDLIGILLASNLEPRAYPARDVRLLEHLAFRAAVAVANARLHEQVRLLSLTDPLTGLPNRRHMDVFLEKEFAAAFRGRPLSVVLFDLDDFKSYNDTEGHQAGDGILRRFAAILARHTRAMNLTARYGGDEFVVILSDTHANGAHALADRITTAVRADEHMLGIGATAGIAAFHEGMTSPDELIRSADEALYRAKAELVRHGQT